LNETQPLQCQLSKSVALPTMMGDDYLDSLAESCISSSGWTPARWCCSGNSYRHSMCSAIGQTEHLPQPFCFRA